MAWHELQSGTPRRTAKPMVLGISCIAFLAGASLQVHARSPEEARLAAARSLVAEYQELRRSCAELTDDARRSCFHELHANNSEYRMAKQQLKSRTPKDRHNVHLVTF